MSCDMHIDFSLQVVGILKGLAGLKAVQRQCLTMYSSTFYIPIWYVFIFIASTTGLMPSWTVCAVWNNDSKSTSLPSCFDPEFCC